MGNSNQFFHLSFNSVTAAQAFTALVLAYVVSKVIATVYAAYLGPLSKIPVPSWQARWPHLYFLFTNYSKGGRGLAYALLDAHRKLGPVVRYDSNKVSFCDPKAYDALYGGGRAIFKKAPYYDIFTAGDGAWSLFTAQDVRQHRQRRKVLSPMFSRQSILSYAPLLRQRLKIVVDGMFQRQEKDGSVEIIDSMHSFALDVITTLAFGKSLDAARHPQMKHPFLEFLQESLSGLALQACFPLLNTSIRYLPSFLIPAWAVAIKDVFTFARVCLTKYQAGERRTDFRILFDAMCATDEDGKPAETDRNILNEAVDFLVAGTDTSGNTISEALWRISEHPEKLQRLREEVRGTFHSPEDLWKATLEELEALPYLSACVKEALRTGDAVPGLLPRLVPDEGWTWNGYVFPAGTGVASSSLFVHYDESIFTSAEEFRPERWLEDSNRLDPWMVQFSKGLRQCLGRNLATAEITVALAIVPCLCDFEFQARDPRIKAKQGDDRPTRIIYERFNASILGGISAKVRQAKW